MSQPPPTASGLRPIFASDSPDAAPPPSTGTPSLADNARVWFRSIVAFYRDPLSWLGLITTAVLLCYVGGAAMFWFHSEYLGEGGPAIPWEAHWLLDSTFGFVSLTPVLAVILPLAVRVTASITESPRAVSLRLKFSIIVGTAFALITTPGPIAHDLIVGRGTWIANEVTTWLGDPNAQPAAGHHYAVLAKLTQQLGFGLPLYMLLAYISVLAVRSMHTARWTWPERSDNR